MSPPSTTSPCPSLGIAWTRATPEAPSAVHLPAATPQLGYGNMVAPFGCADSLLPGIFTCTTQAVPPAPMQVNDVFPGMAHTSA